MTRTHDLMPNFPVTRLRRARMKPFGRQMTQEHHLTAADFIWPVFVTEGNNLAEAIEGLDGVRRYSLDQLAEQAKTALALGIPAMAIFPRIDKALKDADGNNALAADNLVCRAIAVIKTAAPDMGVVVDIALDPFTTHGHDGLIRDGEVDNDATLEVLKAQALNYAAAGADIVAPSDMMDGRVGAIRAALDAGGYRDVMIMSYAAKYASTLYAPFRNAVSANALSELDDKSSYQMNPANSDEAMREIALDIREGADFIMIKPGMPYLDIIRRATDAFNIPVFAYQVSGEYQMINSLMKTLPEPKQKALVMEMLLAFKRAGCTGILTYFACDVAEWLNRP
jgi:porphobilinogen synthase